MCRGRSIPHTENLEGNGFQHRRIFSRSFKSAISHFSPCSSPRRSSSPGGHSGHRGFLAPHLLASHDHRVSPETGVHSDLYPWIVAHRRNDPRTSAGNRAVSPV